MDSAIIVEAEGLLKGLWVFNTMMPMVPRGIQLSSSDFESLKSVDSSVSSRKIQITKKDRAVSSLVSAVVEQVNNTKHLF